MKGASSTAVVASPAKPPHAGKAILLRDGREWVLPPMTLREVDLYEEMLPAALSQPLLTLSIDPDKRAAAKQARQDLVRIVHTALVHNYPTVTVDEVADLIDLANVKDLGAALLSLNGFVPGEASPGRGLAP